MLKLHILLFLLAAPVQFFAQTKQITIKPQRVVYTRKFLKAGDPQRTFLVRYPVVAGSLSPAVAARRLKNTINYWRVFDTSLADNLTNETSLSSLDYKINYNQNSLLDIALTAETVAAYPDRQTINLVINLETGEQVKFRDVFRADTLDQLASLVDKKLETEKLAIIKEIDSGKFEIGERSKEEIESVKDDVRNLNFAVENFDEFSINDRGVTIIYDAGFPHATKALQPAGRYFFTYVELQPFIKPGSLLSKFIR